tara:strand:- start:2480 stop:2773 length:294 start_codon:yes stop_codon:yes gene_type:complete
MKDKKRQFLEYLLKNYDNAVKEAQGGPYIEIDLIPNGDDDKMYTIFDILESCNKMGIDAAMFTRSYKTKEADGIRMGRYFCFMQETTHEILNDLKKL